MPCTYFESTIAPFPPPRLGRLRTVCRGWERYLLPVSCPLPQTRDCRTTGLLLNSKPWDRKKTAKAEAAEQKQADKLRSSTVIIKRIERNKRKYVTAVSGLEAFDLELKKVAKEFGKKFATGSSVTKTPSGGEEIVVQGDVSDEIEEFLLEKYKQIPEDNIEFIDDKKKKKEAAG